MCFMFESSLIFNAKHNELLANNVDKQLHHLDGENVYLGIKDIVKVLELLSCDVARYIYHVWSRIVLILYWRR